MNTQQEIDAAVNAANEALYHLTRADEQLAHAQDWGIIDLLGGGLITTMIKHSKMSDATQEIEQAKRAMRELAGYLKDFRNMPNIAVDNDGFLEFADYFFDGIIADWFVQSRINNAKDQVKSAIAEVQGILDGLEELR